ncbi:MAG: DUF4864 domain-containing protein [Nitrospira sp.]|jgi:hypothetical protein|nr:DUF4864 domain-containing protein [Nitrospira sp.]
MGVLVFIVACAVLLMGGYWWAHTSVPLATILDQLTAIDEGLYPQAYNYLSSSAQATLSFSEFVTQIEGNSVVRENCHSTFPSRTTAGATATVSGILQGCPHLTSEVEYRLVKDGDEWKIEWFQWGRTRLVKE